MVSYQASKLPKIFYSLQYIGVKQQYLANLTSFSLVTELYQIYKQRIKTRDELETSLQCFIRSTFKQSHIYYLAIFQSLGHPSKLSLELLSPLLCVSCANNHKYTPLAFYFPFLVFLLFLSFVHYAMQEAAVYSPVRRREKFCSPLPL